MTEQLKSDVKGVYYVPSHKCWLARTKGKRTLCRSKFKSEAEQARIEYDRTRKEPISKGRNGQNTTRERYPDVRFIDWPVTTGFEIK